MRERQMADLLKISFCVLLVLAGALLYVMFFNGANRSGFPSEKHIEIINKVYHGKASDSDELGPHRNIHLGKKGDAAMKHLDKTCHMSPDPGTGVGRSQMWYFDHATATCKEFDFKGNGGNDNRFVSKSQCDDTCGFLAHLTDLKIDDDPKHVKPVDFDTVDVE